MRGPTVERDRGVEAAEAAEVQLPVRRLEHDREVGVCEPRLVVEHVGELVVLGGTLLAGVQHEHDVVRPRGRRREQREGDRVPGMHVRRPAAVGHRAIGPVDDAHRQVALGRRDDVEVADERDDRSLAARFPDDERVPDAHDPVVATAARREVARKRRLLAGDRAGVDEPAQPPQQACVDVVAPRHRRAQLACSAALSEPQSPSRASTSTAPVTELRRNSIPSCPLSVLAATTSPSGVVTFVPPVT